MRIKATILSIDEIVKIMILSEMIDVYDKYDSQERHLVLRRGAAEVKYISSSILFSFVFFSFHAFVCFAVAQQR